jgi:hypothetical protein
MRCTCEHASREARNAALEEAAHWHDGRAAYLGNAHCEGDAIGSAAINTHRFAAKVIRGMKGQPSDIVKTGALRDVNFWWDLAGQRLAKIGRLKALLAEAEDHISQANDTIARMSRCQTAGELQAYRETRDAEKGKPGEWKLVSRTGEAWAWHAPDAGDVDA